MIIFIGLWSIQNICVKFQKKRCEKQQSSGVNIIKIQIAMLVNSHSEQIDLFEWSSLILLCRVHHNKLEIVFE